MMRSGKRRTSEYLHAQRPRREAGEPYVRGASGLAPKKGADKYVLAGVTHRFDGKCHKECENLT